MLPAPNMMYFDPGSYCNNGIRKMPDCHMQALQITTWSSDQGSRLSVWTLEVTSTRWEPPAGPEGLIAKIDSTTVTHITQRAAGRQPQFW